MKRNILFFVCLFFASLSGLAQNDTVIFSAQGGFYQNVFQLDLMNYYSQNQIRYTLNGDTPNANSTLYTGSLTLDSTMYSKSNIYTIVNTIPSTFFLADGVQRAIVIRAAAFDQNGNRLCQPVTNSYFIRSLGCDFHGLPVVSIATDSLSLFDYDTGIFVPGATYVWSDSLVTGNYRLKGIEWEREINMEFYQTNNIGINQRCGLRTHGNASRRYQQKGMKLYAREEYGKKRFSFPFFNTTPIVRFKHICLHPFRCSNWFQTGGLEYLSQTIAHNLDIDALAVRQCVVFINGEYWGIYTLEEAPDERYAEDHYPLNLEEMAMIKYWGVPYYGDPTDWRNFYIWINTADLSQPEDWEYACQHVDLSNFLDYMLFETFSANRDWPQNNVKLWQPKTGEPFRWLFYDGDGCFSLIDFDATDHACNSGGNSRVFNHFRDSYYFLKAFRDRYYELYNTYFSYDYMKSVLDEYSQLVGGEVEAQMHRFHFPTSLQRWQNDMVRTDDFLAQRDAYFRTELERYYGVEETALSQGLLCYPNPSSGEIRVAIGVEPSAVDEIAIYDMMGKRVFSEPFQGSGEFSEKVIQPQLAAGVYLLKAGRFTQRIVRF